MWTPSWSCVFRVRVRVRVRGRKASSRFPAEFFFLVVWFFGSSYHIDIL